MHASVMSGPNQWWRSAVVYEIYRQSLPTPMVTGPAIRAASSRARLSSRRGGFRTCDLSRAKNAEDADPEAEDEL
jgi:hypothetical protein